MKPTNANEGWEDSNLHLDEETRRRGATEAMANVLRGVHTKKALPLVLIACDPNNPARLTVFPCGPDVSPMAILAILKVTADVIEKQIRAGLGEENS